MKKTALFILVLMNMLVAEAQIKSVKVSEITSLIQRTPQDIILLNFWATFCKPCVAEIPNFIKVCKEQENVSLLFVSVDASEIYPEKLMKFARKRMKGAEVVWLDETDASYFCPVIDGSWGGSIPATLLLNKKSGKRIFVEGEMSENELRSQLKEIQE
jgi:thiol-disulfide isomerase/thioredoxin